MFAHFDTLASNIQENVWDQIFFFKNICYSAYMKTATLETVLTEIKLLRREVSLFMPNESIEDFSNKAHILASLKRARN